MCDLNLVANLNLNLQNVTWSCRIHSGRKWSEPAIFWYEEICHCESVFIGTSGTKIFLFFFLKKISFYWFSKGEEWRGRERMRDKHHWLAACYTAPSGDWASNSGMFPDLESNQWHLIHGSMLDSLSHTIWARYLFSKSLSL